MFWNILKFRSLLDDLEICEIADIFPFGKLACRQKSTFSMSGDISFNASLSRPCKSSSKAACTYYVITFCPILDPHPCAIKIIMVMTQSPPPPEMIK